MQSITIRRLPNGLALEHLTAVSISRNTRPKDPWLRLYVFSFYYFNCAERAKNEPPSFWTARFFCWRNVFLFLRHSIESSLSLSTALVLQFFARWRRHSPFHSFWFFLVLCSS